MALLLQIPMAGGFRYAEPAYYLAHRLGRDRLTGNLTGELVCYANETTRRAHQVALQKAGQASADLKATTAALDAARAKVPTGIVPEDNLEFLTARVARDSAAMTFNRADLAAQAPELRPGSASPFVIPANEAAGIVADSGAIDVTKVYAWLKAQPQFAGAQDA